MIESMRGTREKRGFRPSPGTGASASYPTLERGRRAFLKRLGLVAAGTLATGLLGCGERTHLMGRPDSGASLHDAAIDAAAIDGQQDARPPEVSMGWPDMPVAMQDLEAGADGGPGDNGPADQQLVAPDAAGTGGDQ
jgi:hypothetical protein